VTGATDEVEAEGVATEEVVDGVVLPVTEEEVLGEEEEGTDRECRERAEVN